MSACFLAHVIVKGEVIPVLVTGNRTGVSLHMRSGKLGRLLEDESAYLASRPDLVAALKSGKTVRC